MNYQQDGSGLVALLSRNNYFLTISKFFFNQLLNVVNGGEERSAHFSSDDGINCLLSQYLSSIARISKEFLTLFCIRKVFANLAVLQFMLCYKVIAYAMLC